MGRRFSKAVRDRVAAVPAQLRGRVTLERAEKFLDNEYDIQVSKATIGRVWRSRGVSPCLKPRFGRDRTPLILHLAATHPGELGLEHDYWSLGKFRDFLVENGIVHSLDRETVADYLDRQGIERPSDLWPCESRHPDR